MKFDIDMFTESLLTKISPFIDKLINKESLDCNKFMRTVDSFIYEITGDELILDRYIDSKKNERLETFKLFIENLQEKAEEFTNSLNDELVEDKLIYNPHALISSYIIYLIMGHMITMYPEKFQSENELYSNKNY